MAIIEEKRESRESRESREKRERKRRSVFWLAVIILALAGIISYAASLLFFSSNPQKSNYRFRHIFTFNVNEFFTEGGDFTPGVSKSINPIVTSNATIDAYVIILVEMPKFGRSGLYTVGNGDDWMKLESWSSGDSWFEVYMYGDVLQAGASTKPLGNKITMREMTNAQYGQYAGVDNLKITMTAYACGTDQGETMESAWGSIKSHFNLGE